MINSRLSKCVLPSARIASIFDWKQSSSILSLDISKHRICISVGQHPDREHQHIIQKMKPIEYMPHEQKNFSKAMFKTRKEHVKKSIEKVVKKFNISGFVVGWPLEPSGNPGAACGRVLHLLDFLADKGRNRIISPSRPLTLMDQRVFTHNKFDEIDRPLDRWGRSSAFCPLSLQDGEVKVLGDFYISSHGKDEIFYRNLDCSQQILEQFFNSHFKLDEDRLYKRSSTAVTFDRLIRDYDTHGGCIEASLL